MPALETIFEWLPESRGAYQSGIAMWNERMPQSFRLYDARGLRPVSNGHAYSQSLLTLKVPLNGIGADPLYVRYAKS